MIESGARSIRTRRCTAYSARSRALCRAVQIAALVDVHGLARHHVALELEPDRIERHALRGDHPLDTVGRLAHAEHSGRMPCGSRNATTP